MSQHARRLLLGILVVLALARRPSAEVIEQILVKVNGEILTKTDLEQRQVQAIRAKGISRATMRR
jgi:RNA-binding protein YlmH